MSSTKKQEAKKKAALNSAVAETVSNAKKVRKAIREQVRMEVKAAAGLVKEAVVSGKGKYNILKASGGFTKKLGGAIINKFTGGGLYTGSGSYTSVSNNLVNGAGRHKGTAIMVGSSGDETGSVFMTYKEFIGEIYGPGTAGSGIATPFSVQSFPINPGVSSSFPFLSQLAQNFEEYQLYQLLYFYESLVTDIGSSTTGQVGSIAMSCLYNSNSANFSDKISMVEYAHSATCKVSESCVLGVECDPNKITGDGEKLVRSAPVLIGEDPKSYDLGKLNVAVCNAPAAYNGSSLGELWVYYTVKLRKPRLYANRGLAADSEAFYTSGGLTALAAATPWGAANNTAFLRGQQNNIGILCTPQAAGVRFTFPANYVGNLRIIYKLTGTGLTALGAIATQGNVTLINDFIDNSVATNSEVGVVAGGSAMIQIVDIYVTNSTNGVDNFIGWASATGTTVTSAQVSFTEYNTLGSIASPMNTSLSRVIWVNSTGTAVVP